MSTEERSLTPQTIASRGRFRILTLLFFITAINYLDRSNLSVALPYLSSDFRLSATEQGVVLSAFSWAYVVAQLPGGWLVDRVGPRVAYMFAITTWSIFTILTFFARGLGSLVGVRLALGVAEAPSYPSNNALVVRWFPSPERARATSVYLAGQYIGLAIALPTLSLLVVAFGWRSVFVVTGALGLIFVVAWRRWGSDRPDQPLPDQPLPDQSVLDKSGAEGPATPLRRRVTAGDFRYLLSKRRLWGLYISQFCNNGIMWFFLTWFPTYLVKGKGIPFLQAGFIGTIPYIAAPCGVLLSGYVSDRLLRSGISRTWARKTPIMTGFVFAGIIVLANYTNTPSVIIAVMTVAFFAQGLSAIGWTLASEIAPLRMVGLSGGMFNLFTNLGGAVIPVVVGIILDATGSFNSALVFIGCLTVVGLLAYIFLIDRVERLDPDAVAPLPVEVTGPDGVI